MPGACDGRERAPGARVVTLKTGVGRQADAVKAEVLRQEEIGAEVGPGGRLALWIENPVPAAPDGTGAPEGMGIGLRNVSDRLATRFPGDAACTARIVAPGRLRTQLDLPVPR